LPAATGPEAPVSFELTVGKKEMRVNGTISKMDVAPVIVNGRTLVPVRFVSQALNSGVLWDGGTRNVTVIRGANWIDLWVGDNHQRPDHASLAGGGGGVGLNRSVGPGAEWHEMLLFVVLIFLM
jgi:hypothetical protein